MAAANVSRIAATHAGKPFQHSDRRNRGDGTKATASNPRIRCGPDRAARLGVRHGRSALQSSHSSSRSQSRPDNDEREIDETKGPVMISVEPATWTWSRNSTSFRANLKIRAANPTISPNRKGTTELDPSGDLVHLGRTARGRVQMVTGDRRPNCAAAISPPRGPSQVMCHRLKMANSRFAATLPI
jgi:hypothetical protein